MYHPKQTVVPTCEPDGHWYIADCKAWPKRHAPEAHVGHDCSHLLSHHEQEVDHVLRLTSKLGTKFRVLQETKVGMASLTCL